MKAPLIACLACLALCRLTPAVAQDDSEGGWIDNDAAARLTAELPRISQDLTITESAQLDGPTTEDIGKGYNLSHLSDSLNEAIAQYESGQSKSAIEAAREHLRDVLIAFIIELLITLAVLQIAFSLVGFPCLFWQIILLSLAVSVPSALLDYFLYVGLLNPIRFGISFVFLLLLIRQLTDVRSWATAIRIALTARLISLGLIWVGMAGVMAVFGL